MKSFPSGERPVREETSESVVSPDVVRRLQSLLKELYRQRSIWRRFLPPQRPPTQKETRIRMGELTEVESLEGAKAIYLDDAWQCHLPFLTELTLATRRRVERVSYHGESIAELVAAFRERLLRCPRPHLLIADGCLEMLPSMDPADRSVRGYRVLDALQETLHQAGVPAFGYSSNPSFAEYFERAGADGFFCKKEDPRLTVRHIAKEFPAAVERIRQRNEEKFIRQD